MVSMRSTVPQWAALAGAYRNAGEQCTMVASVRDTIGDDLAGS